jgi:hypothetical protein
MFERVSVIEILLGFIVSNPLELTKWPKALAGLETADIEVCPGS